MKTIKFITLAITVFATLVLTAPISPLYAAPPAIVVNSTADDIDDDGECTLREATISAETKTASGSSDGECAAGKGNQPKIIFDLSFPATITLLQGEGGDQGLILSEDMKIEGPGPDQLIIDANKDFHHFTILADVEISGVRLINGESGAGAGAIVLGPGISLSLNNCVLNDNESLGVGGGAISNAHSSLDINKCLFFNNVANSGGAIYLTTGAGNTTSATINQSSFFSNFANYFGGAIEIRSSGLNSSTTVTINQSDFFNNTADIMDGGAIRNWANNLGLSSVTINNATVADNLAKAPGALRNLASNGSTATMIVSSSNAVNNLSVDGPPGNDIKSSSSGVSVADLVVTNTLVDDCDGTGCP